jgi:hypothetical protein
MLPRATASNGAAVEEAKVDAPKIYCEPDPFVEAIFSPKLNAVFAAVVKLQFQS